MYLIRYFVKCKPSGILLKFFRNSSKIQIGIPIRKATGFANMIYFTYKYSFSTCLVNVSCRWCIALWFEKISWPASNNCPFSWCCWNKKWRLYLPNETKREKPSEINIHNLSSCSQNYILFVHTMDYGQTKAKSLILCGPNSNSNPNKIFGMWTLKE